MEENNKINDPDNQQVGDQINPSSEESQAQGEASSCDNVAEDEQQTTDNAARVSEEVALWIDKYVRLQAEFDNYRKRTLKEKMDLVATGGEDVIKAMLPVLDDLDRALSAMESATDVAAVKEGVLLISNKLRDTMKNRGVAEIEAVGKELDTDFHEAVAKIPAPNKSSRGKILDVIQKGYTINDKVIRHSKVVVGE